MQPIWCDRTFPEVRMVISNLQNVTKLRTAIVIACFNKEKNECISSTVSYRFPSHVPHMGEKGSVLCCYQCAVTKSCQLFFNSMDCSPSDSSVHEIFQAGILERIATAFSRGSFLPRDQTHISCMGTSNNGFQK